MGVNKLTRRGLLKASAGASVAAAPLTLLGSPAFADPTFEIPPATDAVTPFRLRVPESALTDLRRRLAATRWPERETVGDGSQGVQLERVRKLSRHWLKRYDWRRLESRLNGFGQYRTSIDGLGIHFLHVRSKHRNATPLLLTHGWPGSVVEFLDAIGPLTDPTAHGGKPEDAFHVVVPSLPGFGFSDKPTAAGWSFERIAKAWAVLMERLGYDNYLAQGGDWGAAVTAELAKNKPAGLAGIHLNFFFVFPPPVGDPATPEEQEALNKMKLFEDYGSGYFKEQATRPQQMGYSLTDSPVGQAAWIFEKFTEWTDSGGEVEGLLGYDRMLDDIMLYWLPATAASSARIYWEFAQGSSAEIEVPVGFSAFPREIAPTPKIWVERTYKDALVYYNKPARGGHFAAFEQPHIFTEELRKFARLVR